MKRIFASLAATCLLLTGCGKVQSPDFEARLKALDITFTPVTGSSVATVAPAGTLQFTAVGLYSTPPGSQADSQTVPCATTSDPQALCTRGSVSGVTWSVDATASTTGAIASVDSAGRATGLRRGNAVVRARVAGLEDATEPLLVDGEVLESITISSDPVSGSVPTGRNITLTATPSCSKTRGGPAGSCTKTDYAFAWSLPTNFPADTVVFSPNPPVGRIIVVKTNRFGAFSLDVKVTNEEGNAVQQSVPLNAVQAVLDSIAIRPVGSALPVSIANGTTQDFVLVGTLSNGQVVDPVRASDVSSRVEWATENNGTSTNRGQVTLESQTGKTSPNSTLRVTATRLGVTNVSATAVNTLNEPALNATTVTRGNDGVVVVNALPMTLTQICPAVAPVTECPQNVQISIDTSADFVARGMFTDGQTRAIPNNQLDWTKAAGIGDVTVDAEPASSSPEQGITGTRRGAASITATIKPASQQPGATPVTQTAPVAVVDGLCIDEFLTSEGVTTDTAGSTSGATTTSGPNGNLIDNNPTTFTTVTLTAATTNTLHFINVRRNNRVTTATTDSPKSIGVFMTYDDSVFRPDQQMQMQLLNATGGTIGAPLPVTATSVTRNGVALIKVTASATTDFSGVRLIFQVPNVLALTPISGGSFDPALLTGLTTLLLGGGSIEIQADSACSAFR